MRPVHRSITRALCAALALGVALAGGAHGAQAQVTVGGVGYAQYQYNLASDTLTADSAVQHVNNFDITRAYLNVIGRFAGGVGTRVTADILTSGNIPGSRAFRIKYAYVTWTPENSPLTFKLGQMHTPWLDWEEALWDYRVQGQMAMERGSPVTGISYLSSSDFGAGVDGKWNADQFNFQAGIFNGENYNGALGDQRKDLMARASYRVLATDDGSRVGGLRLTGYAQLGTPSSGGMRNRFLGMLSYRSMDLTLAAEVAVTNDSVKGGNTTINGGAVAASAAPKNGRVISLLGVYHFPGTRVSVIGRADLVDPQTADSSAADPTANTDKTTRIIVGLAYQLSPNLRLLADVDLLSYDSNFRPTAAQYAAYAARQSVFLHAMFTF